ncbi:hypothetical protein [Lentilactobacillus sp. SPB1-3]|uniref:Uncharacterized protein n=1 Tax=Lentilactobacillus terminaliae TaxID=3003483 RepID=A0ACD5DEP7_9LACO|nr:hypothetical protein [Lentilactobacillus sp. SPB1-3]MCZ0977588.1 hypothetical protein [Lentilactobacillus sp. SPB1-3]
MNNKLKMREFILTYLSTQANKINLQIVKNLINYGKNNNFTATSILNELFEMDSKHSGWLNATIEIDYVDGVILFSNHATEWLSPSGYSYLHEIQSYKEQNDFNSSKEHLTNKFEKELNSLLKTKVKLKNEHDKVTLQELIIELRHNLNQNDHDQLKINSLKKFKPFVSDNWDTLSEPMKPILVELANRFLFNIYK